MAQMNICDILNDVPSIPDNISVLLRGDHGIGKSQLVRQLAQRIAKKRGDAELPVIDRRLSQLTQGDIIGLPWKEERGDGKAPATRYAPPDWYVTACERPVVLFLDELNRAEPEVMQAAFQIVLDRELNGFRLHEGTRVFAAVNLRSNYNVQQIDPALLDRFFVIDVNFTPEEWLVWAQAAGIHTEIIDFIRREPAWLQPPPKYDAGTVQPSPRSWERVNDAIKHLLDDGCATGQWRSDMIRRLCGGFVGTEASMAFIDSLQSEFKFSGEDILERYSEIKHKMKMGRVDVMVAAADKLVAYCDTLESVNEVQAANLKLFIWDLVKDHRVTLWQKLARKGNERIGFIRSIHPSVAEAICDAFGVPIGEKGIGVLPNVEGAVRYANDEDSK